MKWRANLIVLMGSLFLAGCATPVATPTASSPPAPGEGDAGLVDFNGTWQPQLLYLLPTPHSRLYVEVVAVRGCEPSAATLGQLREFLTTYCEKPDGIEIVRHPLISRTAASGLPPRALARKYLEGPPAAPGAAPACLLVVYFDGALTGEHARNAAPHADLLPYPAIYINARYPFAQTCPDEILLHEAGHLLGLVGRPDYAAGYHCLDPNCLMNRTLRVSRGSPFPGRPATRQIQLCGRCMQELVDSLKLPPLTNLRYAGPVLVRSEAGYEVLALPYRVKIVLGDLTDADSPAFAAAVQAEPPRPGDQELRVTGTVTPAVLQDPARLRDCLDHARVDPLACVRTLANRMWLRWQQQQRAPAEMAANKQGALPEPIRRFGSGQKE